MWDILALIGIIAAIVAIAMSHRNYKKKIAEKVKIAVAKSHHKAHKKGQKRQY